MNADNRNQRQFDPIAPRPHQKVVSVPASIGLFDFHHQRLSAFISGFL
jgi:hypothetical protein